jgi:glucose-1-phosphate cytidylyltransferase
MKVVILAGGAGTRLMEETGTRPKPMVEIGGRPIIWHIMKIYSAYGVNEFIICLGYKGYVIKEYFSNYYLHMADVTIDMTTNSVVMHETKAEPWKITLVDTGIDTMTGGRLKRVRRYLGDEDFCMTYGDAVSTVDIGRLIAFHHGHGCLATVTGVRPQARFGALSMRDGRVEGFLEKPEGDGQLINGGFFVLKPAALDHIEGDDTVWERGPMERLARDGQLMAFEHDGFWQPMDTLREKRLLEDLWDKGHAPWRIF